MIDKNKLEKLVEHEVENTEYFLVDIEVNTSNVINVFVDGDSGISIHECVRISRLIERQFDRDDEDYELRVSSPGLDKAFKQLRQYEKYINRDVKILTYKNERLKGKLLRVDEAEVEMEIKEGKKKKDRVVKKICIPFADVKEGRPVVSFK